jgi:hypothetical protein
MYLYIIILIVFTGSDSELLTFVKYNIKDLHHRHICNVNTKKERHRINGFSDFVHRPDSKELEHKKFFRIQTMHKVRKPINSVCYTPSSERYRIYKKKGFL